jgi:hypothetical protein
MPEPPRVLAYVIPTRETAEHDVRTFPDSGVAVSDGVTAEGIDTDRGVGNPS